MPDLTSSFDAVSVDATSESLPSVFIESKVTSISKRVGTRLAVLIKNRHKTPEELAEIIDLKEKMRDDSLLPRTRIHSVPRKRPSAVQYLRNLIDKLDETPTADVALDIMSALKIPPILLAEDMPPGQQPFYVIETLREYARRQQETNKFIDFRVRIMLHAHVKRARQLGLIRPKTSTVDLANIVLEAERLFGDQARRKIERSQSDYLWSLRPIDRERYLIECALGAYMLDKRGKRKTLQAFSDSRAAYQRLANACADELAQFEDGARFREDYNRFIQRRGPYAGITQMHHLEDVCRFASYWQGKAQIIRKGKPAVKGRDVLRMFVGNMASVAALDAEMPKLDRDLKRAIQDDDDTRKTLQTFEMRQYISALAIQRHIGDMLLLSEPRVRISHMSLYLPDIRLENRHP